MDHPKSGPFEPLYSAHLSIVNAFCSVPGAHYREVSQYLLQVPWNEINILKKSWVRKPFKKFQTQDFSNKQRAIYQF